jgi:hypothetical protein
MTKLIKILVILTILIFVTGCEEKPIGKITKDTYNLKSEMDPRLKAYPEAVEWYKDSDSYPEAAFSLGYFYNNTLKDYNSSIKWYKIAYKMGYLKSANNMGTVYEDLKDYKEAIRWYEIASNAKVDKAPNNLGYLYKKKYKDYKVAIKWYKVGIERESILSIKGISWLYHENLNDDIKATAYMINILAYGENKEELIDFFKTTWNLSDETIKKGYELQLTMPGLPRRYKGGI